MAVFMIICSIMVIGLMFWISHIIAKDKDLIKNDTLKSIIIEQNHLIVEIQEGYAGGLDIGYNGQTIYSQDLGTKVSKLTIENYPSIIHDNNSYHLMLYQYEHGGHGFSGFDFCVNQGQVFYGKQLGQCSDYQ